MSETPTPFAPTEPLRPDENRGSQSSSPMAKTAPDSGMATDPTLLPGGDEPGRIDPAIADHERYVFGEAFAAGGIGLVRRGADRRLGREIAIKELLHVNPRAQRRFALEAAITARLQHPGIVPLYDLGWRDTGEPYYCMKLVDGECLEAKIDQAGDLGGRLRLLEHVIAVADTIAYAHEQQVLHRDLKPANVLVGRFGETVVIDWGLAKDLSGRVATEATDDDEPGQPRDGDMTEAGAVMGTLRYMPPEQASGGAVDVRSDIYALGAMLYHVLAGQPPYAEERGPRLMLRVVDGECADVRTIDPTIPRELAAITQRAMARDPADRYASAAAFAEDLRRFKAGRLVSAHAYSFREVVSLWLRRYRVAVAVAAVLLLALLASGIAAAWRIDRARVAAETAEREATANLKMAETAVLRFLSEFADDPRLQEADLLVLRKELLADAIPLLQQMTSQQPAAVGMEFLRGQALLRLAELCLEAGDYEPALSNAREAASLFAAQQARQPGETEAGRHQITALRIQVKALTQLARHEERDDVLRQAVELAERLMAESPGDPEITFEYARTLNDLGLRDLDEDPTRSMHAFTAMQQILQPLVAAHPGDPRYRQALVSALGNAALGWSRIDDSIAAVRLLETALAEARTLVATQPRNGRYRQYLGSVLNNLVLRLRAVGRDEEAEQALAEALAVRETLAAGFPSVEVYGLELAETRTNLANLRRDQGRWDEALAVYATVMDALAERAPQGRTEHLRITEMKAHGERAALQQMRGRYAEAAIDWALAAEVATDTAASYYRAMRATALLQGGEVEDAIAAIEPVLRAATLPRSAEFGHPLYYCAGFYARLAGVREDAALRAADTRRAEELLRRAVKAAPEDQAWLLESHELAPLRELLESPALTRDGPVGPEAAERAAGSRPDGTRTSRSAGGSGRTAVVPDTKELPPTKSGTDSPLGLKNPFKRGPG